MNINDPYVQYTQPAFLAASKLFRQLYTLDQITSMWNESGLGKPASNDTIERWLNLGPQTKNPRFEPWCIGIANAIKSVSKFESQTTIVDHINTFKVAEVLEKVFNGDINLFTRYLNDIRESLDKELVEPQTIQRYCHGGAKYLSGPPKWIVAIVEAIYKARG